MYKSLHTHAHAHTCTHTHTQAPPLSPLPVDGRRSPVFGKQGRVVDNGAMLRVVDNFHGNKLGAEWQDVQLRIERLVLIQNVRQDRALVPPARELEHGDVVLLRLLGEGVGSPLGVRYGEDGNDIMTLSAEDLVDLGNGERGEGGRGNKKDETMGSHE